MTKDKKQNYLDFVPVRNEKIDFKNDENGTTITLLVENTGVFNTLAQKLIHKPRVTQVHVDEIGSFLWPLIDGERTVNELAQLLEEHFGDAVSPLYDRIVTYFEILKTNEFITFKK